MKFFLDDLCHELSAEKLTDTLECAVVNLHANVCEMIILKALDTFDALPSNPFRFVSFGSPYLRRLYHGGSWAEALEETVKVLLSHEFDIDGYDTQGQAAVRWAVILNEPVIASILWAHGASLEPHSTDNINLLHAAICSAENSGDVECFSWLLECGIPLVTLTSNLEPLHVACLHNAYGAVKHLLEHEKVDVDIRTSQGETALHIACSRNALESFQLLLDHGADTNLVNNMNATPLEVAVHGEAIEVVELFLKIISLLSIPDLHQLDLFSPSMLVCMGGDNPRCGRCYFNTFKFTHLKPSEARTFLLGTSCRPPCWQKMMA